MFFHSAAVHLFRARAVLRFTEIHLRSGYI